MVLGNRKLIVASTLMALPVAFLMASLTTGTSPDDVRQLKYAPTGAKTVVARAGGVRQEGVRQAVGSPTESNSMVQQVGLLETMAERRGQATTSNKTSKPASSAAPKTSPNTSAESGGLLSSLFSGNGRPQPSPTTAKPADVQRPPADWNGIPFHEPRVVARSESSAPIRDPATQPTTRIIRSGDTRTLQAIPASARRETRIIVPQPTVAMPLVKPVPTPAPQVAAATTSRRSSSSPAPLSSNESSRRSDRRTVDVLQPSRSSDSTSSKTQSVASDSPDVELIPKVSRRQLPSNEEASENATDQAVTSSAKAVAKKTAAQDLKELPQVAAAVPTKTKADAPRADQAAASENTNTEIASTETVAKSTLSPPTAAPTPPSRVYTTPDDTNPAEPMPIAGIPSRSYAASTSSASVSHRAGPPVSDFQPREEIKPAPSQLQLNAVSAPIGSGLLPQLPQPDSSADADAYIAAAPQTTRPSHVDVPTNSVRASVDPYAGSAVNGLQAPQSSVPIHSSTSASTGMGFDAASTEPEFRDETTRRLKPGDSAVASELPGIRVVTNGPSEIMIRQTQQYEIRVENRGSIDAQGVMVRAMIPDWADVRGHSATKGQVSPQSKNSTSVEAFGVGAGERLVWTIDQLPAGATERMFISLRAERSGSHGVDVDWTLIPQKSVTKVHVHEPRLALVIDGPPEVTYGQSQIYKVRVMNPGDGIAPNVVFTLSPNSATPQTQRIGDIPAGKEAQFEVELTAQDLGDLKIHGLAAGDLELRAEATKIIHVAAAKLEAILSGPEVKYQNTEAVYQLQVKNSGNAMTEQVVATLQLPGGAKYLGGIADSLQRGQVIKWKIDALAPNATRDYEFRCNMASTGDQLFSFDCQGTAAAQASVSIATRVESIADLVMTINDPIAPAPVSTEVAYEIVVRNRGSKDATDVRAIAQFSHGIEPKRLEGHSGEVLTGQVLFDPIPRIGAGEEVRLRIVAEADRAGHHRFRSEIRSGSMVLVAEEATHFMDPQSERISRSSADQKVVR